MPAGFGLTAGDSERIMAGPERRRASGVLSIRPPHAAERGANVQEPTIVWNRLHAIVWPFISSLSGRTGRRARERPYDAGAQARLLDCKPILHRILTENIIPFWYPGVLDLLHGGYCLNHDPAGRYRGPAAKGLVSQARTLWFFARLVRDGYRSGDFRQAADCGYRFLRDRLWDQQSGGFHWEFDPTGAYPLRSFKHAYGHAFALYGLSEYALASQDPGAAAFANEAFKQLDSRFHDPVYGGYLELYSRDWSPLPETESGYFRGAATGAKLMNSHLHLLEAITAYYRLTGDTLARERLLELILVLSNAVVRKQAGACTDRHDRTWNPNPGPPPEQVSYGHDIENISLLCDACDAIGLSSGPLLDLFRTLFANMLRFGYDKANGGAYASGPIGRPARDRDKIWWVQAETLLGSLHLHRRTGETIYAQCFLEILNWIARHQVDWEHGDWHAVIRTNGTVTGDKAGPWKTPYHAARAMMDSLALLERLPLQGHPD